MNNKKEEKTSSKLKKFGSSEELSSDTKKVKLSGPPPHGKLRINRSNLFYGDQPRENLADKTYQWPFLKSHIITLLNEEMFLEKKLRNFIEMYLDVIHSNPDIPFFVLYELNNQPNQLKTYILDRIGKRIKPFLDQLREGSEKGNVINLPAEQILANIMSLMIFPPAAGPAMRGLYEMEQSASDKFFNEKKRVMSDFIVQTTLFS
ncbi:MAG: hypothetical protein EA359_17935 [Balneolaceae bacterium]|nr:MAG: hypothetical protein EA359_17935 [Balneolaceae bacterium]